MKENKKIRGSRRDGVWLRDLDSMHYIMPYIYPNRCDNEAYISEKIDITAMNAFLEKKNADSPEFKYTMFHVILAALVKTVTLRPKMNRFVQGRKLYQRDKLTAAFVVKKSFDDDADEALAFLEFDENSTVDSIHSMLKDEITRLRGKSVDNSTASMDIMKKLPRFICDILMRIFIRLDFKGRVPESLVKTDPYYATMVISNLGSIKLKCGYHHLTNWGTCSLFCIIGEKKRSPFFHEDGTFELRDTIELGLTIDERIADGYYYSKTMRLLRKLLENPELLEAPAKEGVEY